MIPVRRLVFLREEAIEITKILVTVVKRAKEKLKK